MQPRSKNTAKASLPEPQLAGGRGLDAKAGGLAPGLRKAEGFPGQRLVVLPPALLKRQRQLPVCRDIHVTHIGSYQSAEHHFVERPAGAPEYILIVCLGGRGHCQLGGKRHDLSLGHALLLPPGQPHRYWAEPRDPWTLFWVHFSGLKAAEYAGLLDLGKTKPVCWFHDLPTVSEAFEQTYRHVLGGHTDADLVGLSTGLVRLLGLCRLAQRALDLRQRRTEDRVLRTLHHMHQNLGRQLSLAQLAALAHWTPTHYSSVFRRQLNLSPIEYFLRLKIQRACELLRTTDLRVSQISEQLGYEDPLYFSRLFRRRAGETPRGYRNKYAVRAGEGPALP